MLDDSLGDILSSDAVGSERALPYRPCNVLHKSMDDEVMGIDNAGGPVEMCPCSEPDMVGHQNSDVSGLFGMLVLSAMR